MANMNDKDWQDLAEDGLKRLIEGVEVTTEKMDKDGCVHELRSVLPPNVDAIKFALKNRSKGKWADKTEVTHTQVNLNLTASYNEVKELMNKEKQQGSFFLPKLDDEDVIDVEVDNAAEKTDS